MNPRYPALAALVLVVLAPLLASPASSVSTSDCDVHNYALRNNTYPKWRQIPWTYSSANEPLMADGVGDRAVDLAARTWTNQVNTCGAVDRTTVLYTLDLVTTAAGALNNGVSEVFWRSDPGYGPSFARYEYAGECDIVLNSTWGDVATDAEFEQTDLLATIIAREMGWCIGLADPGTGQLNTMNGGWCEDAFIRYFATKRCGLTLSDGDMIGLQLLWPV